MARIFLIGFMGSGKTTLGRELSALMKLEFIDLDEVMERKEGTTISELFQSKGEEYFRTKESFYLKSFGQTDNVVISTGGGTPCFHDNMQWMNDHGITVYLKLTSEILFQRLKPEINHRPLLAGKSEAEARSFIASKLQERQQFYEQARLVINTETSSPLMLVQALQGLLN